MSSWSALFRLIERVTLTVWLAALATAAISASIVFSTLPEMSITLAAYADYPASGHGMLAASRVMYRVFLVVDTIQFVAAPLAVLAIAARLLLIPASRRAVTFVRAVSVFLAAALFSFYAFGLAPEMNRHLLARFDAARAGDVQIADEHRAAFEETHPTATAILSVNAILLLMGIAVGSGPAHSGRETRTLQTPLLANRR